MGWTDMGCSMGYSSMDCSMNRSMTWIPPRFHRLLVTSAENTLRHYHSMLKAKKVFLEGARKGKEFVRCNEEVLRFCDVLSIS